MRFFDDTFCTRAASEKKKKEKKLSSRRETSTRVETTGLLNEHVIKVIIVIVIVIVLVLVCEQSYFYIRNNRSPQSRFQLLLSSAHSSNVLSFSLSHLFFYLFFFKTRGEEREKEEVYIVYDYKFLSPYFATSLKSCRFFISPRYICYRVGSRELYQWTSSFSASVGDFVCFFPFPCIVRRWATQLRSRLSARE